MKVYDDPPDNDKIRKIIREQLGPLMNEKVKNFGKDMLESMCHILYNISYYLYKHISMCQYQYINYHYHYNEHYTWLLAHSKDVYIEPSELGTASPPRPVTPNESTITTNTATITTTTTAAPITTKEPKGPPATTELGNVTTIKETVELQTSADQVYETLLDPGRVAAWTRSRPDIFRQVGTTFSLFDGNITGNILELVIT